MALRFRLKCPGKHCGAIVGAAERLSFATYVHQATDKKQGMALCDGCGARCPLMIAWFERAAVTTTTAATEDEKNEHGEGRRRPHVKRG